MEETYLLEYTIRELHLKDFKLGLLSKFNRYQEVKKCWRMENGAWLLKDIPFVEQWDELQKNEIGVVEFPDCVRSGGAVWGALGKDQSVIGFASLSSRRFGSREQYVQLTQLHVSCECRHAGIGKALFAACAERARSMGAEKLYISAHSSEETQAFYAKVGCVDAHELDLWSVAQEPCDRQLECVL